MRNDRERYLSGEAYTEDLLTEQDEVFMPERHLSPNPQEGAICAVVIFKDDLTIAERERAM